MFQQDEKKEVCLRRPLKEDGLAVHRLVAANPPLDVNSPYSYYLLCEHFAETCVLAEFQGEAVGFISAYRRPDSPSTLFVWQVVVDPSMRGRGLAREMLLALLSREIGREVSTIESTVNPSNQASRRVFERFAEEHGEGLEEELFLNEAAFGEGEHESEILLRIPLRAADNHGNEVIYAHI